MSVIVSIPILLILLMLQSTIAGKVTLLNGAVDLILVWLAAWGLNSKDRSGYILALISGGLVAYVTALPWYVYLSSYLSVILLSRFTFRKLWESPLLAMFAITLISSIFLYLITFVSLRINGTSYPFTESLNQVIIPSVFLNLFVAIPIYAIVKDFSRWIYHTEEIT